MSHCSKFNIQFMDKRLLFKAMRNLGMNPENRIWAEYGNQFKKALGIYDNILGRLLTGVYNNIHVLFIEKEEGFMPYFESHTLNEIQLEKSGRDISILLKKEYLKCTVQQLADDIISGGGSARIVENTGNETYSVVLKINDESRTLNLEMDANGIVNERVNGVIGKSCIELTKGIDSILTSQMNRTWTHEYDTEIEDQVVQVLKLTEY